MQRYTKKMSHKTAIISMRKRLGIPDDGLPSEKEALAWYREHFRQTKGAEFKGSFGFHYQPFQSLFEFDYQSSPDKFSISIPYPLDHEVPLDREVISLARELNTPDWAAPTLRLVLLVGKLPEELEFIIPNYLIAPLGGFRLLIHPTGSVSLRRWRETGAMMGLLPSRIDMWKFPGTITSYSPIRKNKKEPLYWQTFLAYGEAIEERRKRKQKGKKGLLKEAGLILEKRYNWGGGTTDSYKVRRYLDRAEKIWHISSTVETKEKLNKRRQPWQNCRKTHA
jgi:hypothetical protein